MNRTYKLSGKNNNSFTDLFTQYFKYDICCCLLINKSNELVLKNNHCFRVKRINKSHNYYHIILNSNRCFHVYSGMQNQQDYRCSKCDKEYRSNQSLRIHTQHCVDNEIYICLICKPLKQFPFQSRVVSHFLTHPFVPTNDRRRFYKKCKIVDERIIRMDNKQLIEEDKFCGIDVSALQERWIASQRKSE